MKRLEAVPVMQEPAHDVLCGLIDPGFLIPLSHHNGRRPWGRGALHLKNVNVYAIVGVLTEGIISA